ncbi:MAG: hypothetical protein QM741_16135 [Rudaea sp.]|uniref:hypothetical protein n=1 Tax=Rudaea sp. TaxID=2136325 RepID=UPI0039E289DF
MVDRPANPMFRTKSLHAAALAGLLGASLIAPGAHACSVPDGKTPVQAWPIPSFGPEPSAGTAQADAAQTTSSTTNFAHGLFANDPITGLWKINMLAYGNADIPNGVVLDAAIATWHADGTELMNSSRAPKTQSFCQGVWERTATNTYILNHLAMSWTDDGSAFLGPTSIHETVSLSHNATLLTGTFTLVQYATDGTTVLAQVVGNLVGSRVFADE